MQPSPLAIKLRLELDELARKFISAFGLKYTREIENLNCPLMRWLDFRMRYVEPRPRLVIYSNRFPKSDLPLEVDLARIILERKVRQGEDVNPFQGKSLTHFHDTSGKKHASRTDKLWASWGIVHFHLTMEPPAPGNYYSPRSNYQAFCVFDERVFVFLDIRKHPKNEGYADPDFLNIINENWPDIMSHYELRGILPGEEMTATEIKQLWDVGMNTPIFLNGKTYFQPGYGITSAGTSLKAQMLSMHIHRGLYQLSELIESDPQFKYYALEHGVSQPEFSITVSPKGFVVYEVKSKLGYKLNVPGFGMIETLRDQTFPTWAIRKLIGEQANCLLINS